MCKKALLNLLMLYVIFYGFMQIRVVQGSFQFVSSFPRSLQFGYDDRLEIDCTTNNSKALVSLWTSKPLHPWNFTEMVRAPGQLVKNGSVFILYKYSVDDGYALRCRAENPEGQIIWSPEPPIIVFNDLETKEFLGIGKELPTTINAGETLILQCFVKLGFADPNSVHWLKDGVELATSSDKRLSDKRLKINRTFIKVSSLFGKFIQQVITVKLIPANEADSGLYMCKGSEERNKTVKVDVKALKPPKLSWKPENKGSIVISEEQAVSVQLQCNLQQGNPKPKFLWLKDGKPLYPKENWLTTPSCAHLKEGIYYFTNGSKQDVILCGTPIKYERFAGKYTCHAENEKGSDKIDVELNILAPAKIQEPKQKNTRLVVEFGTSVYQICRARGNPPPKVEWRKLQGTDSKVISQGEGNQSVSLSIRSMGEKEEGNYSCVARQGNKHTDEMFVQIKLASRPGGKLKSASNSSALIGIVIGCVAVALIIAVVALYVGNRRHLMTRQRHLQFSPNLTLSPTRHFKNEPPLQAKELTKADSVDMMVVNSQQETDFTPSYCESFHEEDATTKEIAEFLARKKDAKARASLLKNPELDGV